MLTSLTPLAWNHQVQKDRQAALSRAVFILKIKIRRNFGLREVSVLSELALALLPYSLTDVPSKLPPGTVFRTDRAPTEAGRAKARTVARRPLFASLNKWKKQRCDSGLWPATEAFRLSYTSHVSPQSRNGVKRVFRSFHYGFARSVVLTLFYALTPNYSIQFSVDPVA